MNKYSRTFILSLLAICSQVSQAQDVQQYYTLAKEAHERKDYQAYYENILEANKLHPYHQGILYQLGIASALTQHPAEAIDALGKAIHIKSDFDLADPELQTLVNTNEFKKLTELQTSLQIQIISSDTAFTISERDAHIESVAYDPNTKSFFMGSIHKRKIIKRDARGKVSDFINSEQFGLTSVFGLRVDAKRGLLWACASPMPEMINYDSTLHSAVFKFDLKTGKLLGKYEAEEPMQSVFGDLTLNSKGEAFISDGVTNTIYIVNDKTKKLEPFYTSDEFWNLQGITFSDDDQNLFISDYIKGPYVFQVSSKKLVKISSSVDASLKGIDGLLWYGNSLIAIQNGVSPLRVSQYKLDSTQTKIISSNILDRAHPAFNEPTIGCLEGSTFYFVANSQWGAYDEAHHVIEDKTQDIVILRNRLEP